MPPIKRFVRGRIYLYESHDMDYNPILAVLQFRELTKERYRFNILAVKSSIANYLPGNAKYMTFLKDKCLHQLFREIPVTDLPLYMNLEVYPAMEKILKMGEPSQRQLRTSCRRRLNQIRVSSI